MIKKYYSFHIRTICFGLITSLLFVTCKKTPNPNEILQDMALEEYPPWEAPQFGYEELLDFFPGADYSGLTSYYVAPTGSDQSGDGSSSNPFKTIQYAVYKVAAPGVIIRVKAGTYNESVGIPKSIVGTKNNPFVLYSQDGIGAAIIDATFQTNNTIKCTGQYVVIDGFEVKNANLYAVVISGSGPDRYFNSYSVLRNCHVHHAKSDVVKVGSINFVMIEYCDIHDVVYEGGEYENCIDGVGVYHTICRFNILHDNKNGGGGYFKSGSFNNIWCYNIIKDMLVSGGSDGQTYGIQIGGSGVGTSYREDGFYEYPRAYGQVVFNNLFMNCAMSGIHIVNAWETKIYNNTFYNCGYEAGDQSDQKAVIRTTVNQGANDNGLKSKYLWLYNNVAYNEAEFQTEQFFLQVHEKEFNSENFWHGHNLIFNNGTPPDWGYPNNPASTETIADPLFANPSNCNFFYTVGSPAIAKGKILTDVLQGFQILDCNMNYSLLNRNGTYDLGAFQQ